MPTLIEDREAALSAAQTIVNTAKAAGRDLTATEHSRIEAKFAEVERLDVQLEKVRKSADLVERLAGAQPHPGDAPGGRYNRGGTGGTGGGSTWAKSAITTLSRTASTLGVKALLTGEVSTPPAVEVSSLPDVPTRLLDLIPREPLDANTYAYLRQVVRDEHPGVVADNATKPTSTYTFQEVEARARVVAHLSEPFPLRYLTDHETVMQVLDGEMRHAVLRKVEDQIINGNGTGENFRGILITSGVLDVPFDTDRLTTVRGARTRLEDLGEEPNAWVLNPTDAAALELTRENGATGGFLMTSGAYDVIFGQNIARVTSNAVPQGTAILADWTQCRLRVREDVNTLAATQAGDLFAKNQVMLRTEGRYNIDVKRPQAFAVVDLTA